MFIEFMTSIMPKIRLLYFDLIKIITTSVVNSCEKGTIKPKQIEVNPMTQKRLEKNSSHMPKDSFFFEKLVPVSLVIMGIIMVGLMIFAAGVLLGIVKF